MKTTIKVILLSTTLTLSFNLKAQLVKALQVKEVGQLLDTGLQSEQILTQNLKVDGKKQQDVTAPLDHKKSIRLSHAKELLGKYYDRSVVRHSENLSETFKLVDDFVRRALKGKWKKHVESIAKAIIDESLRYEFDPYFLMAVIENESSFIPDVRGTSGEIGLMQILPRTAQWIAKKFKLPWKGKKTLEDPVMNIRIGAAYLSYLRQRFDSHGRLYLAAYNMGSRNVRRALNKRVWPKDYAYRVMKRYIRFYTELRSKKIRNM